MIITSRVRADIVYCLKKGMSNTAIVRQMIFAYGTLYMADPHKNIADTKDLKAEVGRQRQVLALKQEPKDCDIGAEED